MANNIWDEVGLWIGDQIKGAVDRLEDEVLNYRFIPKSNRKIERDLAYKLRQYYLNLEREWEAEERRNAEAFMRVFGLQQEEPVEDPPKRVIYDDDDEDSSSANTVAGLVVGRYLEQQKAAKEENGEHLTDFNLPLSEYNPWKK